MPLFLLFGVFDWDHEGFVGAFSSLEKASDALGLIERTGDYDEVFIRRVELDLAYCLLGWPLDKEGKKLDRSLSPMSPR
jgi:hypothetical protein